MKYFQPAFKALLKLNDLSEASPMGGASQNNREMDFAKKLKILDLGQYQSNAIHARVSGCLKMS